jgi:hypothetical protein
MLQQVAVPRREDSGLVTMLPALVFESGGAVPGPGAVLLERSLSR